MKKKKVLVAPLDWGLGHATRCIPIIRMLLQHECEVLIATSGLATPLLKKEFPQLLFFELPPYRVRYSQQVPFAVVMLLQVPRLIKTIWREHRQINKIVKDHSIDAIISDNRYGCYSRTVKSVLITHQLTILLPTFVVWLQGVANSMNRYCISRFHECWVPDFQGNRITNKLSEPGQLHVSYIGMLSRFRKSEQPVAKEFDLLILLSGPEPERSVFEKIILSQLDKYQGRVKLIQGLPAGEQSKSERERQVVISHLPSEELQRAIESSNLIIARSGYTTIMDLYYLGKNAIFVPTPGQTEQEYLADQLSGKGIAYTCRQDQFDLQKAIQSASAYTGFRVGNADDSHLAYHMNKLIDSL